MLREILRSARHGGCIPIDIDMPYRTTYGEFPTVPAILFGLGLGGFFDGIVFNQVLQWHHMASTWYPPVSPENLRLNMRWDAAFQSVTTLFVVCGIALLWQKAGRRELYWSGKLLGGGLFVGWGSFNLVEGLVDHALLGIHHVNETVPSVQQPYWDLAFLAWGAAMLFGGRALRRLGEQRRQRPARVGRAPVKVAG